MEEKKVTLSTSNTNYYQFDEWEVYPDASELKRRDGTVHKVEPKVMAALCYFLENQNLVISREQLINVVWSENAVVSDHSLTQLLGSVRKVLGDSPKSPKYIETIPKKGYRFICPVVSLSHRQKNTQNEKNKDGKYLGFIVGLVFLVFAVAAAVFFSFQIPSSPENTTSSLVEVHRLTDYPGVERSASVSPDGKWVAFSWEDYDKPSNLFIKPLDSANSKPTQLTFSNAKEISPVWSPDGNFIAFIRQTGEGECALIKLHVKTKSEQYLAQCGEGQLVGDSLEWAPNGDLYFKGPRKGNDDDRGLSILLTNNQIDKLACSINCEFDDLDISASSDGRFVVVTRQVSLSGTDLFLYDKEHAGNERRISFDEVQILGHTFSDNSENLYYATLKEGTPKMWRYDLNSQQHSPLTLDTVSAIYPTVVHGTSKIVFARQERTFYIAQLGLNDNGNSMPIVQSYASNMDPAFDNQNNRIAYTSAISGGSEIWVADTATNNFKQVTVSQIGALSPAWSLKGNKLVYIQYDKVNDANIQWLDIANDQSQTLPVALKQLWGPQFTLDEKSIVVTGIHKEKRYIWQVSLKDKSIKKLGGEGALVVKVDSRNGNIFYTKENAEGLYYYDINSKTSSTVIADLQVSSVANWVQYEDILYFLETSNSHDIVKALDLTSKNVKTLNTLPKNTFAQFVTGSFTIKRRDDQLFLIFVHNGVLQGDLMMANLPGK